MHGQNYFRMMTSFGVLNCNDEDEKKSKNPYFLSIDFLIDGQISSFCPDQHEGPFIRVDPYLGLFGLQWYMQPLGLEIKGISNKIKCCIFKHIKT